MVGGQGERKRGRERERVEVMKSIGCTRVNKVLRDSAMNLYWQILEVYHRSSLANLLVGNRSYMPVGE